jgi:hypothetical protein
MPALTYNQANSIVIKNDIVLNTYTQYILKTEKIQGKCDDLPKFVLPTPIQGTVIVLKATMTLTVGFYVHSTVR